MSKVSCCHPEATWSLPYRSICQSCGYFTSATPTVASKYRICTSILSVEVTGDVSYKMETWDMPKLLFPCLGSKVTVYTRLRGQGFFLTAAAPSRLPVSGEIIELVPS